MRLRAVPLSYLCVVSGSRLIADRSIAMRSRPFDEANENWRPSAAAAAAVHLGANSGPGSICFSLASGVVATGQPFEASSLTLPCETEAHLAQWISS